MSWHTEIDDEGNEIEVDDYDQDEVAEDELCDCWRYHFSHCYQIGCFGNLASRVRWDDDEDEDDDESDDGDDERSDDEPSSNSSDIPFYYPLSENPDITQKGDILS